MGAIGVSSKGTGSESLMSTATAKWWYLGKTKKAKMRQNRTDTQTTREPGSLGGTEACNCPTRVRCPCGRPTIWFCRRGGCTPGPGGTTVVPRLQRQRRMRTRQRALPQRASWFVNNNVCPRCEGRDSGGPDSVVVAFFPMARCEVLMKFKVRGACRESCSDVHGVSSH